MCDHRYAQLALAFLCLAAGIAEAGTGIKILEPQPTHFPPPPEPFASASDVALDGNRLAIATFPSHQTNVRNVYVYERSPQGTWSPPSLVLTAAGEYHSIPVRVALRGNLLAMAFRDQLHIAELTASGWQHTATITTPPGITQMGRDVEIDGGTVVVSGEVATGELTRRPEALIFRKSSSGAWQYRGHVSGSPFQVGVYEDFFGGDVDISGDTIIVGAVGLSPNSQTPARARAFTNTNGIWVHTATFDYPLPQPEYFGFANRVAIEGDTLILGESGPTLHLYRRSGTAWSYASSATPPEVAVGPQLPPPEISGNLVVQAMAGSRFSEGIFVYERDGGQLRLAAKLLGPMYRFDISARTVIGAVFADLRQFQLPTDLSLPALRQDDFQDGDATGWATFPTTNWSVVTSGHTRVLRQSNLASGSQAILTGTDWTQQAVQADITPTAFDGADRWFGLATRFIDPFNYYYVTVRSSNTLLLRKMVNGNFQTIASSSLTVTPNRTYRVRLESIGTRLRVLVDDSLMIDATDTALNHGQAALLTYRTRADFDNVIVSPNPFTGLFADSFFASDPPDTPPAPRSWIETGTGVWEHPPEDWPDPDFPDPNAHLRNYRQTSLTGGARSHVGVRTDDQAVQTRVMPTDMASSGWFGVMARYIDDGNYYYLKVGNAGEASIRKLVDGAIFELAHVPFTPSVDTWYTVKLEAVGNRLRAFINDRFLMEATDSSHAAGKYGVVTYRATATFDDFRATQP